MHYKAEVLKIFPESYAKCVENFWWIYSGEIIFYRDGQRSEDLAWKAAYYGIYFLHS